MEKPKILDDETFKLRFVKLLESQLIIFSDAPKGLKRFALIAVKRKYLLAFKERTSTAKIEHFIQWMVEVVRRKMEFNERSEFKIPFLKWEHRVAQILRSKEMANKEQTKHIPPFGIMKKAKQLDKSELFQERVTDEQVHDDFMIICFHPTKDLNSRVYNEIIDKL